MRKIYINLGCGDCVIARRFLSHNPDFEAYGFDPCPFFDDEITSLMDEFDFKHARKSAWIRDETKTLYFAGSGGVASTLHRGKFHELENSDGSFRRRVTECDTECFHFSRWVEENFSPTDYIYLYMDIEIAEFDILDDMISRGTIEYVNEAMVEFHRETRGIGHYPYPKELKEMTSERFDQITSHLDENFKYKMPLHHGTAHGGGMWHWIRDRRYTETYPLGEAKVGSRPTVIEPVLT